MVKVFKTGFFQIWKHPEVHEFMSLFCPEVVLFTSYDSNTDIGKIVNPQGYGSHNIKLGTGIGANFENGRESRRIFTNDKIEHSMPDIGDDAEKYVGELVQDHAHRCSALEGQFGEGIEQVVNAQVSDEGFVTLIGHSNDGAETFTLETRFRAPRYFLPDGFPLKGDRLFDARVYSEARKTGSGIARSSGIFTADGIQIQMQDPKGITQLLEGHRESIQTFLKMIRDHYYNGSCYRAQDLLEVQADMLSYVDHWDYKERQLMQSARSIARAIYEESPLRGKIKGVALYGSLARKDKIPGDIDLMLLVDSADGSLNPFRYFSMDDQGRPARYNVDDVTNGIAKELGIIPVLLKIGRKSNPYFEYPDDACHIQFSELGGGINLSVVSTDFFNDSALRERYMRLCFTPTYFQDALTDGLAFDAASGEFSIPTRAVYSGVIAALKDQLRNATIQNWPNIANVRPEKTF